MSVAFRALLGAAGRDVVGGGVVSVVQGGDVTPVNAASVSVTLPGDLSVGNTLVLAVAARSAITTPSGYTLEYTTDNAAFGGHVAFFSKTIELADRGDTVTVNFGASGRGGLAWVELSSTTGNITVEDTGKSTGTVRPMPMASATAAGADRIAIAALWDEYAATGGSTTTRTVSAGWTLESTATRVDNRLALASRAYSGATSSGTFGSSVAAPWDWSTGTIMLAAA